MKQYKYTNMIAMGFMVSIVLTEEIRALPMFTTQTGMDCTVCHMQSMPKLNSFGRNFMLSGMTMSQQVSEVNSSDMDINPSLLIKAKYEKSWDKPSKSGWVQEKSGTTNEGIWSIPRTVAGYLGGRISENVGTLVKLSYSDKEHKESISGKMVYAKTLENGIIGATVYSSSNFGPFSGMEVYNTGLYKPLRSFESRKLTNATQACNIGTGAATGFQAYYDMDSFISEDDHFFLTLGMYAPGQDNFYLDLTSNLLPFARLAYEYPIGDFNVIFGAFAIVGGSSTSRLNDLSIKRETYGIDFQLEGELFERSISLIATNVFKNKVKYTGIEAELSEDTESYMNDAFSIEGQIMVTEDIGIKVSYLQFNDRTDYEKKNYINVKDLDYSLSAGLDYSFVAYVPMKLALEFVWARPSLDRVKDYEYALVTLTLPF